MIKTKDNDNKLPRPVPTGNDISEGDAREEPRVDKDEDLKKGDDNGSPLAAPFKEEKKHIAPDFFLKDSGDEHNKHNMDEHEELDPTMNDAEDLRADRPDIGTP